MPGLLLKRFESHCPEKAKAPSYSFFLAISHKGWCEKPNGWYKLSLLGENQIGKFFTQLKRPLYGLVESRLLTTRFLKQASHGYLMVELQKIS